MDVFVQTLSVLQFSPREIEEYKEAFARVTLVRFQDALKVALSSEEIPVFQRTSQGRLDFVDIKTIPDEALRKKLVIILTSVILGVLGEFTEEVGKSLTHEQRTQFEKYMAGEFTQSDTV